MLKNKTHIFEDPARTAHAVAMRIINGVNKKKKSGDEPFNLALSGGSTPNILFELLAGELKSKLDWSAIRLFWVDERCVPPTDKESNYGVAKKLMISKVPIAPENVFRMKGEVNPAEEAARYRTLLAEKLPKANGLPQFDMILLGMGDDGHTASIFPDRMVLLQADETVAIAQHPISGQYRVSLTGKLIENAKELLFVITGDGKAEVLDEIMHEKQDFERYPSYYILANSHAELYLDHDAAKKL